MAAGSPVERHQAHLDLGHLVMGGRERIVQLTRSTPADLATAWRHRDHLVDAASRLVVSAGHPPDSGSCADAGCALAGTGDELLCGLARRLAVLAMGRPADGEAPAALSALRSALTESLDAVRVCRQTAHPGGICWFAALPGDDGCGEVLHLAHEAG